MVHIVFNQFLKLYSSPFNCLVTEAVVCELVVQRVFFLIWVLHHAIIYSDQSHLQNPWNCYSGLVFIICYVLSSAQSNWPDLVCTAFSQLMYCGLFNRPTTVAKFPGVDVQGIFVLIWYVQPSANWCTLGHWADQWHLDLSCV